MLTRLKVNGFKNLVDVDVAFGPFTCIAGVNGVGKSNLFDAITFLGSLAEKPLLEAALSVRSQGERGADLRSIFHRVGDRYSDEMAFGAEMLIPNRVIGLDCTGVRLALELSDGRRVKARTVVVASGARYRRPDISNLDRFEGHGVWYWASPIEARLCRGQQVALVGGGNSAGQAAVFLSPFAAKVSVLVRGASLAATMSRYLIDRIEATANIEVLTRTEIVALAGSPGSHLERVRWRQATTGAETERPIHNLFLFVGADPATQWLRGCGVSLDGNGFVRTGSDDHRLRPLPLETNVPGVFAVGDVRSGSVKRVGSAIGEGAAVVAQLHAVLADVATPSR